tara:strand:+ start:224 stop:868 length:645 start_codon:yes stop_codon:yes gene_type:complete
MKIKKIIKLLECIEGEFIAHGHSGKLPSDMYELGVEVHEQSNGEFISVKDMDFVHLIRAFIQQEKKISDEKEEKEFIYDSGLEASVSQTNQITKLEKKVSELLEENEQYKKHCNNSVSIDVYEYLKERNQDLHKRLEEKSYREVTAPRYVFSEIPNDCDGQRFVDDARKYFNRSRYNMRVRGQHIKDEYKGTGATAYGQNIEQSTHLRVYIEEK